MSNGSRIPLIPLGILAFCSSLSAPETHAQANQPSALTVRLIHPDQQAAEFLRLFEGSGAKSPAEILARWKTVTREPALLGKPLEALIAIGNPQMVAEWRVFHQTVFRTDGTGSGHWFAIIPHDDGTAAAALTAMRLSYDEETPLLHSGRRLPVARLSRTGFPVACQAGPVLVLGSSREELARGLAAIPTLNHKVSTTPAAIVPQVSRSTPKRSATFPTAIESGIEFEIDPTEIVPAPSASVTMRRLLVLVRSLAGTRMAGSATLANGSLSAIARSVRPDLPHDHPTDVHSATVQHEWLALIPADRLIGFVSLAIDSSEPAREAAFALVDQVDRADPARARVAAARTRLNLLAAAVGVRPELDIWPHLKGASAGVRADEATLGAIAGGWLIFHFDRPDTAAKLLTDILPRIASSVMGSGKWKPRPIRTEIGIHNPGPMGLGQPLALGAFATLPVHAWQAETNIVIAWGDPALEASRTIATKGGRTVADVCENWKVAGKPSPARVGALWPGRLWIAPREWYDAPATRAVVDLPPIVWWGWNEPAATTDVLNWSGLKPAIKRLVQALPLGPNPVP